MHSTENTNAYFIGYEVFYRIYCGSSSTEAPASASTDASVIEENFSATVPDVIVQRLLAKNYKTIVGLVDGSGVSPLISISATDIGQSIQASLDLENGTAKIFVGNVLQASSPYQPREIRRNVTDSNSANRLFTDPTTGDDCNTSSGSTYFWIKAYAVAYGITDDFQNLYSTPLILANTINLPTSSTSASN